MRSRNLSLSADRFKMHSRSLFFAILATFGVLVAAQDTCPAKCDVGPVDGDRLISDCTAQCNTHFGDPVDAEECVRVCSEWPESLECEVVVTNSRRSASPLERRRRSAASAGSSISILEHSGVASADFDYQDDNLHQLEARDLSSCLAGCRQKAHYIGLCPGNLLAVLGQSFA
jgi:hypothetical protein